MKNIFLMLSAVFCAELALAQCAASEVEVSIVIETDAYGYEGYWELVPAGNNCGVGTIASGGNTNVGCNGAGDQNQTPGGYGDDLTITAGPWCLMEGQDYELIYVDDWGDGGFNFSVIVNGYQIESFAGMALGATFPFTASEPPAFDLATSNSNLYSYITTGSYDLSVHIFNAGTTTISSYNLKYQVNGGATVSHNVTGSSLDNYEAEMVVHSTPISIPSNGVYTIKVWTDNLNGSNVDMNNSNDTLTKVVEAGPGTPNIINQYINAPVTITQIAGSSIQINSPTDLDFHPVLSKKELWIINKGTEASGGNTVTISNAGEGNQSSVYRQDGNAYHFMSLPTGIAFSQNGNWATSAGVYDANHNGGDAFTGPTLWSSDMDIYAQPSGGNGSHLDMLHLTPYGQGIASESENAFWTFDGYSDDIVRYDFQEDHGPGNDDHSDGIVRRYADDQVLKDPNDEMVSHLILDEAKQWLYVVDNGNQRVIRIDITTGSDLGATPIYPMNETIEEYTVYTGYTQETVVPTMINPTGIDVIGNRMIVSEYSTGDIILYDISSMPAVELERIPTGKTSVQGIKIGPDGRIWFVDRTTNAVYRVDSPGLGLEELTNDFSIYPNPSNGIVHIKSDNFQNGNVLIHNVDGKIVSQVELVNGFATASLNVLPGIYYLSIESDGIHSGVKKFIIQ